MAILTVDVGGTPLSLDCTRGGHAAPRRVGPKTVGNSGAEESSIRAELMVIPIVTAPISLATAATLRTLFAIGNQVPCAGDICNKPGTITFSGMITDELRKTADSVILNLTLYEIGTTVGYTPTSAALYLTPFVSPADGSMNLATADGAEDPFVFGVSPAALRILNGATPATCGGFPDPTTSCAVTYSSTPEKVWRTAATVAAGYLSGRPTVTVLSKGGTYDRWGAQESMCILAIVRGGVDVLTVSTGYSASNGGFSSGYVSMVGASAPIFLSQIGDYARIEVYGRLGLHAGYADDQPADLARQTIVFGNSGAGVHYGLLSWPGLAILLNP